MNQNIGHGHVFPRPDGLLARCGGPAICKECARDQVRKDREESNPLTNLVQVHTKPKHEHGLFKPFEPKYGWMTFGVGLDGKLGYPLFRSSCGIDIELKEGKVLLESEKIWQAIPSNSFYCPTFAQIEREGELSIGTVKLTIHRYYGSGFFVYAQSKMRPKRGTTTYSRFAGVTIQDIRYDPKHVLSDLIGWLKIFNEDLNGSFDAWHSRIG